MRSRRTGVDPVMIQPSNVIAVRAFRLGLRDSLALVLLAEALRCASRRPHQAAWVQSLALVPHHPRGHHLWNHTIY